MKSNEYITDEQPYLQIASTIATLPKKVYAKGTMLSERRISVAIIGTRRPTYYGTKVACEFAENLARRGVVIISGLAYGIDAAAHKGALQANGATIAVLGHGLDQVYPAGNRALAQQILDAGGLLISPYPDSTPVMKHHFLERNQWVSGLADAVLVVEAEERSGTQATVRYALDQGKEVFAIPGPIDHTQSHGPNHLIKQGAHPALSADDILEIIAPDLIRSSRTQETHPDPAAQQVIRALKETGSASLDRLLGTTGLEMGELFAAVSLLEIEGHVTQRAGLYGLSSRTSR